MNYNIAVSLSLNSQWKITNPGQEETNSSNSLLETNNKENALLINNMPLLKLNIASNTWTYIY